MNIHVYLKAAEGFEWTPEKTAEVERVLREIDRVAEGLVKLAAMTPEQRTARARRRA